MNGLALIWIWSAGWCVSHAGQEDLRAAYDVETYRLDLRVDPATGTLWGEMGVSARVQAVRLDTFELDALPVIEVERASEISAALTPDSSMSGPASKFSRLGDRIRIALSKPAQKG